MKAAATPSQPTPCQGLRWPSSLRKAITGERCADRPMRISATMMGRATASMQMR